STVTGTVTSSFGNTPVAGATVTIGNETTTTDENGQYTITVDSSAEDYNVSVTADGFTDYTGTVTANESEVSEDITLTERNTVKVTVTSSYDGSALEGATVTVGGTACEYEGNGVYTVEVDRADSYEVSVSKSGYTDKTMDAPDNGKPTTVSAELNKLAENIVELINADDDTTLATGFDLVITSATGQFDGNVVYAQSEDRLHGVKLILNPEYGTVAVGNRVRLSGVITHEGTETVVTVTEPLIKNETGDEPITLGLVYKPITNDTLVRVWGHVTEVNGNTFTVNNVIGSFTCVAKPDSAPAVGDVVGVTGIATPQGILARTAADVKVHFVAN
ncbi:MAG: carboxypeptidase regulatory-like domain-containing protein, partial [Abditibacteriota bacterium]|nr:carboxypeptidase regulatory-like domain-containing protein [Abditibacteriota bacterium]